jgi:uncharacterized protein YcnI
MLSRYPTSSAVPDPHPDRRGRGRRRRLGRRAGVLAVAIAGALLVAGPATAHPFVRGGELPVDSLATMTIAMAHGCGTEASAEGDPTTDVSLEVPDWLRVVEVPDEDGWAIDLEEGDDGRLQVVTWIADGAEEPAPDFDLEVVATGEVGEERFLSVFQACDEFVYRWVGTPDAPADDPAIRVTLSEPDPSSPPPPEPEPAPEDEAGDEAEDEPAPDPESDPATTPDTEEPPEDPTDEPATEPLAADGQDSGLPGWFLPVTIVVLLGAIGAVLVGRRGRDQA